MPALSIAAAAGALILHSQVAVDANPGITVGEAGLIIESLNCNPTREKVSYNDHLGRKVLTIYKTPVWSWSLSGKTTLNAALLPGSHPGTALTLAEFASLNVNTANGFPIDEGFISIDSNARTGGQGELWGCAVAGELCWLPSDNIQVFRAAS